jgi:hypothetical protein
MKTLQFIFLNLTLLGHSLVGADKASGFSHGQLNNARVEVMHCTQNELQKLTLTPPLAVQMVTQNTAKLFDPNTMYLNGFITGGFVVGIAFIATFLIHKYFSTHTKTTTKHELSEENLNVIKEHTTTVLNPITQKIDELTTENQTLKQHVQHLGSAIQGLSKKETIVQLHNMVPSSYMPLTSTPTTTSTSSLYSQPSNPGASK